MAIVPNPRTWGASELVTAAKLNADIRDSFNFFKAKPFGLFAKTADQSLNVSVNTPVTWDMEIRDTDGGHSNTTNPSRYTAQTAGLYNIRCLLWLIPFSFTWADATIIKNGTTAQSRTTCVPHLGSGDMTILITEGYVQLAVGDYIEVAVIMVGGTGNNGNIVAHPLFSPYQATRLQVEWVST